MKYILFSQDPIDQFRGCGQHNIKKPTGYYFQDQKTVESFNAAKEHKYEYHLKFHTTDINKIDQNKILVINTNEEFDKLTILFGVKDFVCDCDDSTIYLNWPLLSRYFGGIIVNPEIKKDIITNRKSLYSYRKNGFPVGKQVLTWLFDFKLFDGIFWNVNVINFYYLKQSEQPLTNQTNNSSKCPSNSDKTVVFAEK